MTTQTIDTAMAKRMVEANAIRGAAIIGQPGGWSVMLKLGMTEKPLGIQRSDKPRLWTSLDSCIGYLKRELHIARFDMLDATNHNEVAVTGRVRNDTAERMRRAHEAAAYDKFFREGVQASLDDPRPSLSNEDAKARSKARLQALSVSKSAAHAD
jgi:hypothetical protein